jgi:hypothetical protein
MSKMEDAQRPEQVARKIRQRRRREFGTVLPLAASVFLIYEGFSHPEVRIAGLSGKGLLLLAAVLMVASLGYHLANWRCPACNHYLRGGYRTAFCQRCGALFQGSGGLAEETMLLEHLFQEKVKEYRTPYALHLICGMAVFIVSLAFFLGPQSSWDLPPDGWVLRTFGANGPGVMHLGSSIVFLFVGLAWMAYGAYGITYGARRFAARVRERLDLQ